MRAQTEEYIYVTSKLIVFFDKLDLFKDDVNVFFEIWQKYYKNDKGFK